MQQEEGPLQGGPIEVAWCRQYVERAEREYTAMVDGLLAENEQLAGLARLLARQLDEEEPPNSSDMASEGKLFAAVQELLDCSLGELRQQREEAVALRAALREEQLEAQSLRRRLEDALRDLSGARAGVLPPTPTSARRSTREDGAEGGRLLQAERAEAEEVRRREHAEARCMLVERRCEEAVRRLEGELMQLRQATGTTSADALSWDCSLDKAPAGGAARISSQGAGGFLGPRSPTQGRSPMQSLGPSRGPSPSRHSSYGCAGMESPLNSPKASGGHGAAVREELRAVRAQLHKERAVHRQHIALYHKYLPELAAVTGRPLPPEIQCEMSRGPALEDSSPMGTVVSGTLCVELNSSHAGSQSRRCSVEGSGEPTPCSAPDTPPGGSDDEDYAWQGYLERAVPGGGFEKAYLELSRERLRVLGSRGATEALSSLGLSGLAGVAEVTANNARCFEVKQRGGAAPLTFRCMSERRAAQWVEAINRALRRGGSEASLGGVPAVVRPAWASRPSDWVPGRQSAAGSAKAPISPTVSPPRTPIMSTRAVVPR